MKWLITGGCGFLGTNLIKRLVAEGTHSIRVVDNLTVGSRDDLARCCSFIETDSSSVGTIAPAENETSCELVVGDITDPETASRVSVGADVIVHLAANTGVPKSVDDPRKDFLNNALGTFNYLEAARTNNIKRFIFASSGAPAGEVIPPIHEEMAPHPVSPYGASKLAGEGYCSAYFRTFGIETIALRFSNVYGPGSEHKTSVVAKFIKQLLKGETLEVYGDGKQTRDFIYVDDLINAISLSAITPAIGGETFQIATNSETALDELLSLFKEECVSRNLTLPSIELLSPRLGDVKRNFSDTSKARRLLGWEPEVELKDGIRKTFEYFISLQQRMN